MSKGWNGVPFTRMNRTGIDFVYVSDGITEKRIKIYATPGMTFKFSTLGKLTLEGYYNWLGEFYDFVGNHVVINIAFASNSHQPIDQDGNEENEPNYYSIHFYQPSKSTTKSQDLDTPYFVNEYIAPDPVTTDQNIIVTEKAIVNNISIGNLSYLEPEYAFDFFIRSGIHYSDVGAPGRANFKKWTVQFSTSSTFDYGEGNNGSLSFSAGEGANNSTLSLVNNILTINIDSQTFIGSVTLYYFVNEQIPAQGWNKTSDRRYLRITKVNTAPTISASSYDVNSLLGGSSTFDITVIDKDGDASFSLDNLTYKTSGTIDKTLTRGIASYNITTKVLSFNANENTTGDVSFILYIKDTKSNTVNSKTFTVKLVNPINIDTNFFYDGLDLSNIFQPISFGSSIASNTGYTVNGTDLKDIFASVSAETKISYNTGIKVSDTDLKDIFAKYNTAL